MTLICSSFLKKKRKSLYAEVLRISGLFEEIQREYRVTIAGPTTISAFLNSLQMGFHSLAVKKRRADFESETGAVLNGRIGAAESKLVPVRLLVDYAKDWMETNRKKMGII